MDYVNLRVLYYDYLGFEHRGTIALTQPCTAPDVDAPDENGATYYVYLVDDYPEFNDKEYTMEDGTTIRYAEIRRSDEVIPIYAKEDLQ